MTPKYFQDATIHNNSNAGLCRPTVQGKHTGAVGGVVVAAEHVHVGLVTQRHLGDVGHQVGEVLGGVLPDAARRVGAHRVKVAQRDDVPLLRRVRRCRPVSGAGSGGLTNIDGDSEHNNIGRWVTVPK